MNLQIHHDKERRRFFSIVEGKEAYLSYVNTGSETLVFDHTYVPYPLRGHGIAARIVEHALNYAKENNFKVIPGCSYVRAFVQRNDQFGDLVKE